jgi:hypothetical protein
MKDIHFILLKNSVVLLSLNGVRGSSSRAIIITLLGMSHGA